MAVTPDRIRTITKGRRDVGHWKRAPLLVLEGVLAEDDAVVVLTFLQLEVWLSGMVAELDRVKPAHWSNNLIGWIIGMSNADGPGTISLPLPRR